MRRPATVDRENLVLAAQALAQLAIDLRPGGGPMPSAAELTAFALGRNGIDPHSPAAEFVGQLLHVAEIGLGEYLRAIGEGRN